MKRTITSILFLITTSIAITVLADTVEYFNDFSVGKVQPGTQARWSINTELRPWYSNLRYYKSGDSNIRFDYGAGSIKLANGNNQYGSLQLDASKFLSTATAYDLTAGDLVYECYYACPWNGVSPGGFHHGISINNNQMTFIYHPGYSSDSMLGAFRIEGAFGRTSNQSIGFVPPIGSATNYTMMKLTVHRNDDSGNYEFKTEFGLASSGEYTYSYTHNCPIATIDAAGGIKSIGPYGYKNNDMDITNLRLVAPFADDAFKPVNKYTSDRNSIIASDQPTHWYKLDDPSTNIIKDYGSNPVNGTARNVDMSAISDLRQVADFSGNYSKIDLSVEDFTSDWTAEFYLNPNNISSRQSLLSGASGSLRWIMNNGVPGFTKWGAYDAVFSNPDGGAFDYEITPNEWMHVAFVREDNDMFLYIDGELVGADYGRAIDLPLLTSTIGSNGDIETFAGMMDDIAFYSYALSPEQIMAHANPNIVPEPSTWALLILGAAGLMYWRKRK